MMERRQHERIEVDGWVSLKHPLLGVFIAKIEDLSAGGMSLLPEDNSHFFIMMEVDAHVYSDEIDDTFVPAIPAQVVRVDRRRVGLKFREVIKDLLTANVRKEFGLSLNDFNDQGIYA